MKKLRTIILLSIVITNLAIFMQAGAQSLQKEAAGSNVKIGIFDSRALAMAYYRSPEFMQEIREQRAEYDKAKAAGDDKRVKELEAEGSARQELVHKQGFSTWPVDNILEIIKEKIPEIARQAGVAVIVCKWDIVFQQDGVELIDITDQMVKPFNPDEATLKLLQEVKNQDPVPLAELMEASKSEK